MNVIAVFPPERNVKYAEWAKALKGIIIAEIQIRTDARLRTSADVL